jgi:OOP family OmpA-OmpF porin
MATHLFKTIPDFESNFIFPSIDRCSWGAFMLKINKTLGTALLAVTFCGFQSASAELFKPSSVAGQVFGDGYSQAAPVAKSQAQGIYYRPDVPGQQRGAAHVYVDRKFHTGLLPGGYTAFCVAPGAHTLGAYVNDAPTYKGKSTDVYSAQLEGGKTYFLQVRENGNGMPLSVERAHAERALTGLRAQAHVLSRAGAVQPCAHEPQMQYKDYTLSGDVLFAFGKARYQDITPAGRMAVSRLIDQLRSDTLESQRIVVVGHTDPIGSQAANQSLGLQRADTVRQMLVSGGIPSAMISARSASSSEPVSQGCYGGSKAERIVCHAPDRRVVVRVEASGGA